ncbi:MAG: STAS domain-containing protein [Magnetococcales bacterium]|nr:STAS domain-containing protein [Magnetococcales bacterium]
MKFFSGGRGRRGSGERGLSMEEARLERETDGVLRLPARSTIREVAALREALLGLLNQGVPVVLDCSEVVQTDLSLAQLIIAARRVTGGDGMALRVILPATGALAEQIRFCGLAHEFEELWHP